MPSFLRPNLKKIEKLPGFLIDRAGNKPIIKVPRFGYKFQNNFFSGAGHACNPRIAAWAPTWVSPDTCPPKRGMKTPALRGAGFF